MKVGIIGYGSYVPEKRISVEDIAQIHGQSSSVSKIRSGLFLKQKSVPEKDEDTATIAVAAAQSALEMSQIDSSQIGAIYVGSESHPYDVKPTATIVGSALSVGNNFMAADIEFACKAGTAALQICYSLVKSGMVKYSLAIGADVAQARPGDILEYSTGAGGVALIVSSINNTSIINNIIATIDCTLSVTTNTPDFWRRPRQKYPEHKNRFTGEPSYFKHTILAAESILKKSELKASDFKYVVFHQPNGKFPMIVGRRLGFSKEQIEPGLAVLDIGNIYSASSLIGLTKVLDIAKSGDKILLISYGSGSGSDGFIFTKT